VTDVKQATNQQTSTKKRIANILRPFEYSNNKKIVLAAFFVAVENCG